MRSSSVVGRGIGARAAELVDSSLRALVASAVAFIASGQVCTMPSGMANIAGGVTRSAPGIVFEPAKTFGPAAREDAARCLAQQL